LFPRKPLNFSAEPPNALKIEVSSGECGLNTIDRMNSTETNLLDERKTSALREQFIAVLGHDLRNPLAVIDASMRIPTKSAGHSD